MLLLALREGVLTFLRLVKAANSSAARLENYIMILSFRNFGNMRISRNENFLLMKLMGLCFVQDKSQ